MHAAIYIGMLARLVTNEAVDYGLWHLTRCCVVKVNQWLAVDLELEDRKLGANTLNIECRSELRFQSGVYDLHYQFLLVCSSTVCSSRCLSDATGMRSIISAPNA